MIPITLGGTEIRRNEAGLVGLTDLTMTSREIAELCEARHNDVVETIERLFAKGVLRESRKTSRPYQTEGGGRPTMIYDLTKRDCLVVASGYNDALRARIIDRWLELEQATAPQFVIPKTLSAALRLAADQADTIAQQQATLAYQAPKVDAFARISQADGSMCIRDAAKVLQMRPIDLTKWLSTNGWIYHRTGRKEWLAYQDKIQSGLMEHKVTTVDRPDGSEKAVDQARLTPKGVTRIAELMVAVAA